MAHIRILHDRGKHALLAVAPTNILDRWASNPVSPKTCPLACIMGHESLPKTLHKVDDHTLVAVAGYLTQSRQAVPAGAVRASNP